MIAERSTYEGILQLVQDTYARLSTPDSNAESLFTHPDISLAGSEVDELFYGPEAVTDLVKKASTWRWRWELEKVTVGQEGNVAWAQILASIFSKGVAQENQLNYWTTGVFVKEGSGWQWRYWGGSEPQKSPQT
jgi:hypothetical protein